MSATLFSGSFAPKFQVTVLTNTTLAAPLASLTPLSFASGTPSATWTALQGESEVSFRQRITADLAASGPAGCLVYVYVNGNSWVSRGYSAPPIENEGF